MDGVGNEAAANDAAIGRAIIRRLSLHLLWITQTRLMSGQAIRTLDGEIGLRDRGGYK